MTTEQCLFYPSICTASGVLASMGLIGFTTLAVAAIAAAMFEAQKRIRFAFYAYIAVIMGGFGAWLGGFFLPVDQLSQNIVFGAGIIGFFGGILRVGWLGGR
jgi:hypothetical protein